MTNFWNVSPGHFIKHKPLISEECREWSNLKNSYGFCKCTYSSKIFIKLTENYIFGKWYLFILGFFYKTQNITSVKFF